MAGTCEITDVDRTFLITGIGGRSDHQHACKYAGRDDGYEIGRTAVDFTIHHYDPGCDNRGGYDLGGCGADRSGVKSIRGHYGGS